jgi:hypothetical protein
MSPQTQVQASASLSIPIVHPASDATFVEGDERSNDSLAGKGGSLLAEAAVADVSGKSEYGRHSEFAA